MRDKLLSAITSVLYVFRIFIKKAPLKILMECLLSTIKNMLIVVNSVWLLNRLAGMIFEAASFSNTLNMLVIVVGINISASFVQYFYDYYLKPQSDLKMRKYLDTSLMEHAEKLPLCYYENSDFYTVIKQAQKAVSETIFSAYSDIIQMIGNITALISAVVVVITINPGLLVFVMLTVPMIIVGKKNGRILSEKKMVLAFGERKKQYAWEVWMSKDMARNFKITNAWKIADKHYEEGYEASIKVHDSYWKRLFGWDVLGRGFSITFIMIICYIYGILASVYTTDFSVSGFSVMFVAVMNMISRVRKIYKSYENFCGYGVQLNALKDFMELEPEETKKNGLMPEPFKSLEFCHVWFSYDGVHWVL